MKIVPIIFKKVSISIKLLPTPMNIGITCIPICNTFIEKLQQVADNDSEIGKINSLIISYAIKNIPTQNTF